MGVRAKDIMLKAKSVHVEDEGRALVRNLTDGHHALPVVNSSDEVVGIVSEENILNILWKEKSISRHTAGSLMRCGHLRHSSCSSPVTVSPDTPLREVLETMLWEQLPTIPVVRGRVLVGIIDRKDITLHMHRRGSPLFRASRHGR
jgi:CBS domain-containing protein